MAKKHINVHNTFYPGVNNLRNKQKPSKNRISRPDIRGYPANLAGFRDKYRTSKIPDFCKLNLIYLDPFDINNNVGLMYLYALIDRGGGFKAISRLFISGG